MPFCSKESCYYSPMYYTSITSSAIHVYITNCITFIVFRMFNQLCLSVAFSDNKSNIFCIKTCFLPISWHIIMGLFSKNTGKVNRLLMEFINFLLQNFQIERKWFLTDKYQFNLTIQNGYHIGGVIYKTEIQDGCLIPGQGTCCILKRLHFPCIIHSKGGMLFP